MTEMHMQMVNARIACRAARVPEPVEVTQFFDDLRSGDPDYRIALRPDVNGDDPLGYTTAQDDIVVKDVEMFRMEDMGDDWWLCCYLDGHERIAFNIKKKTGKCVVTEYPNDVLYEHEVRP